MLNILLIGICILLGYVGLCWIVASSFLSPFRLKPKRPVELSEDVLQHKNFEVPIWVSNDISSGNPRDTIFIFAHGYGDSRGFWTDTLIGVDRAGFGVVVLAMPAHDANPDRMVGFGPKESDLIVDAIAYVRKKDRLQTSKIILIGVSMGGAACWFASEKDPSIDGVITEGAFARFKPIPTRWLDLTIPYGGFILAPVVKFAELKSGLIVERINPIDSAKKWNKPALIIHGECDRVMDLSNATELMDATGADLWVVAGARHAKCQIQSPVEYVERLTSFAKSLSDI